MLGLADFSAGSGDITRHARIKQLQTDDDVFGRGIDLGDPSVAAYPRCCRAAERLCENIEGRVPSN